MPNLTIRNLPEAVHRELKRSAEADGRSLNGHIVRLLELAASEAARRRRMRAQRQELEAFVEPLPRTPDSTLLIREDRDTR